VAEAAVADPGDLDARLRGAVMPFVVRGLAADWPLVKAGLASREEAIAYLRAHAREREFVYSVGRAKGGGSLFYDGTMAVNFRMARARPGHMFEEIAAAARADEGQVVYAGSIDIPEHFPTLGDANAIDLGAREPLASIWIGTATTVAAHSDFPDNLAVCAVGRRRFTLFPPDQFANLYLGPLDNTPAGRPVSMVDHESPEFDRYPGYRNALAVGQVADLAPGDALFVPSGWYHRVEASEPFNVLVNYWWRDSPRWMGEPQEALLHAVLSIRDLPEHQRAVWREMFEHYVFSGGEMAAAHLPEAAHGILARLRTDTAGRLRSFLLRSLSR
jgi:oxalate decarboxylase/phosphoglucose isomerase-like protein (cupin superfamily)